MVEYEPGIEIRSLSKAFGRQRALDSVDVEFRRARITALLGQNGSGKSTLIKILAGVYSPDPGASLRIAGEAVALPLHPDDVRARRMHFVHQDLALVQQLSVAENIAITNGFPSGMLGRIEWRRLSRETRLLLERFGLRVDPRRPVRELAAAEQTLVAIARAFTEGAASAAAGAMTTLVLDEPTAALPREQVQILFDAVHRASAQGACVVYVTHRLDEVFRLADDVVVLRDGRVVAAGDVSSTSEAELVHAIVGERVREFARKPPRAPADDVLLETRGLAGRRVQGLRLELRRGEILGIAGLRGSGRSELGRLLGGAQAPSGGEIAVGGREAGRYGPRQAIRKGIAYVPEDRRRRGGIVAMSVRENITLPRLADFWSHGLFRHRAERRQAMEWMSTLRIVPPNPEGQFGKLSGGNQQKAVLAKWFRVAPSVYVFDEPTQGIDVGAKAEILDLLRTTAEQGRGVVLISSEFSELEAVCHRVFVLRDGRVVAMLEGDECAEERITRLCYERVQEEAA
jgi:ribose transport system ATP-binding protein